MKTTLVVLVVTLVGCAVDGYRSELERLPTVTVTHGAEAVAIVAHSMGIDAEALGVAWVVGGMRDPHGEPIAGVAIGCDLWIAWWSSRDTSGASADGPAISFTALAHEVAHCALWLADADDPGHARADWWGAGGMVEQANAELMAIGL